MTVTMSGATLTMSDNEDEHRAINDSFQHEDDDEDEHEDENTPIAYLALYDARGSVTQRFPLSFGGTTIGRSLECSVSLTDPRLSARHVVIDIPRLPSKVRASDVSRPFYTAQSRLVDLDLVTVTVTAGTTAYVSDRFAPSARRGDGRVILLKDRPRVLPHNHFLLLGPVCLKFEIAHYDSGIKDADRRRQSVGGAPNVARSVPVDEATLVYNESPSPDELRPSPQQRPAVRKDDATLVVEIDLDATRPSIHASDGGIDDDDATQVFAQMDSDNDRSNDIDEDVATMVIDIHNDDDGDSVEHTSPKPTFPLPPSVTESGSITRRDRRSRSRSTTPVNDNNGTLSLNIDVSHHSGDEIVEDDEDRSLQSTSLPQPQQQAKKANSSIPAAPPSFQQSSPACSQLSASPTSQPSNNSHEANEKRRADEQDERHRDEKEAKLREKAAKAEQKKRECEEKAQKAAEEKTCKSEQKNEKDEEKNRKAGEEERKQREEEAEFQRQRALREHEEAESKAATAPATAPMAVVPPTAGWQTKKKRKPADREVSEEKKSTLTSTPSSSRTSSRTASRFTSESTEKVADDEEQPAAKSKARMTRRAVMDEDDDDEEAEVHPESESNASAVTNANDSTTTSTSTANDGDESMTEGEAEPEKSTAATRTRSNRSAIAATPPFEIVHLIQSYAQTGNRPKSTAKVSKKRARSASSDDESEAAVAEAKAETPVKDVRTKRKKLAEAKKTALVPKPVILFTGIPNHTDYHEGIQALGGRLTEHVEETTHLVTDKVRRTDKFLSGFSITPHLMNLSWIVHSIEAQRWLDDSDTQYQLHDSNAEKQWSFSMRRRKVRSGWMEQWKVYRTDSVVIAEAPMRVIVESAGGTFLAEQPSDYDSHTVIIGTDSAQDSDKLNALTALGYTIHDKELLLCSVLRQSIDIKEFVLRVPEPRARSAKKSKPAAARRKR